MLAIYARTSNSKLNKNDYSIEDQIKNGISLANSLGLKYEVFSDIGISGTNPDRPQLMELLKQIKKQKITHVYAYDQSRIERDLTIWALFSGECINKSVEVYFGDKKIELNDAQSMFYANLMSLINNLYAKITSQKVKSANRLKVLNGKTHGIKALGIGRDENNNFVEIIDESKIVKEVFESSLKGVGIYEIANQLTKKGYTTKSGNTKWSGSTVDGILKNKIYKGEFWFDRNNKENRVCYKLSFQIIDENLFDKIQQIRSNNSIKSGPKNKYNYLLENKIFCSECGGIHNYVGMHKPSSRTSIYRCKNRNHQVQIECKESMNLTIKKFDTFIVNLIFKSNVLEEVLANTYSYQDKKNELTKKLEFTKKSLKDFKTIQTKILDFVTSLEESEDKNLTNRYEIATKNIKNCEQEISEIERDLLRLNTIDPVSFLKDIQELNFEKITKPQLKDIVNKTISYIKIHSQISTNKFIAEVMFIGFPSPLMYLTNKNMDQFELLLPKDFKPKKNIINQLEDNHEKNIKLIMDSDPKYVPLKTSEENYDTNSDYYDDLSLEYEIMSDVPFDINDYTIKIKGTVLLDYLS